MQTALAKAYAAWWRVRGAADQMAYVHGILIKAFLSDRRRRSNGELPTDRPRRSPTTRTRRSGSH